jgi:hypothetical protein
MGNHIIAIGDAPVAVLGVYAIHIFRSGTGTAKLQLSHFAGEEDSWVDVDTIVYNSDESETWGKDAESLQIATGELAGSVRLTGTDTEAKCSLVRVRD